MMSVVDRLHQLLCGYGSILGSAIGVFIPATLQNGFVIVGIQPWEQHESRCLRRPGQFRDQGDPGTRPGTR